MPRNTDTEERRDQILRAAVEVFGERGYANTTISDIANQAGVAHGTVYLYFRSKAEILLSLHTSFTEWLTADVNGPMGRPNEPNDGSDSFAADLNRVFSGALTVCAQHRQFTEVCLRERGTVQSDLAPGLQAMEVTLSARFSDRVAQAIASGEVRPIRPEFAGALISRLLGVALRRLLELGPDADPDLLAYEMVDFITNGLASDRQRNNPMVGGVSLSEKSTTSQA